MPRIARSVRAQARSMRARVRSFLQPSLLNRPLGRHEGDPISGTYVIATKRGLFTLRDGELTLVLAGSFYGITRHGDSLLVFENAAGYGRILGLDLTPDLRIGAARLVRRGLSPGCHQIDFVDDRLLVADAYNNRILALDLATHHAESHYPLGRLTDGRSSSNYAHLNSIYKYDGRLYVVCHNESAKTGRPSELLVLTPGFEILERIGTPSRSAHNIAAYRGTLYHCDSLGNGLRADGELVFVGDHFTRGLSISDDYILVGGSEYARREDRDKVPGYLYVLRDRALVTAFPIPGMVQEIRRLDAPDYGLSACSTDSC